MNRKEKIYAYITSPEYVSLTFEELKIVLEVPDSDVAEFKQILDELLSEGKIFISKKGRYAASQKNSMYSGIIRCSMKGDFAFLICDGDDEDIYIPADGIKDALDGDRVLVKSENNRRKRREGVVWTILERTNTVITAVMSDEFTALPDNGRIKRIVKLTETMSAKPSERVIIKITDYTSPKRLLGEVVGILGKSDDLSSLTDAILFENNIKTDFSSEALTQVEKIPKKIEKSDFPEREDFTQETIFTIDGDDARDFDDAVSLKIFENGSYELGVHIADVSHYIPLSSPLDIEAESRGTSVYLPNRVIPMLPFELSNGICSLNPGEERLTLSVIMEINSSGDVINSRISNSVICSSHRMTYNDVAKILSGDKALCKKYADIVPILNNMHRLSDILHKKRTKRGSINFDFPESKIILNENGIPVQIEKEIRNEAHSMIEEFMLIANETVAEFAYWAELPFIYRVHDDPPADKIEALRKFIGNFGLYIKGKEIHPKDLQNILNEVSGTEDEIIISSYMLRSMMKAEYKTECSGHFGLAADYYCHFTSPIRRYPDLMIHRILKDYLSGKDVNIYKNIVNTAAVHSCEQERTAELTERSTDDLYKTAYISSYIGSEYTAKISGITNFGIFAELDNSIEGMIRLENIKGDYYEFDERQNILIGKRHGKVFKIGDKIDIEVAGADLLTRRIDFLLKGSKIEKQRPHKTKKYKRGKKNG